jgi:hypothetical protein
MGELQKASATGSAKQRSRNCEVAPGEVPFGPVPRRSAAALRGRCDQIATICIGVGQEIAAPFERV